MDYESIISIINPVPMEHNNITLNVLLHTWEDIEDSFFQTCIIRCFQRTRELIVNVSCNCTENSKQPADYNFKPY